MLPLRATCALVTCAAEAMTRTTVILFVLALGTALLAAGTTAAAHGTTWSWLGPVAISVLPETIAVGLPLGLSVCWLRLAESGEQQALTQMGMAPLKILCCVLMPALPLVLVATAVVDQARPAALATIKDQIARFSPTFQRTTAVDQDPPSEDSTLHSARLLDSRGLRAALVAGDSLAAVSSPRAGGATAGIHSGTAGSAVLMVEDLCFVVRTDSHHLRGTAERVELLADLRGRSLAERTAQELSSRFLRDGGHLWVVARADAGEYGALLEARLELQRRRWFPLLLLLGLLVPSVLVFSRRPPGAVFAGGLGLVGAALPLLAVLR